MVSNWNFSLSKASGDYICFFTDKMMLLPDTLQNLADILSREQHDIVSWIYDRYNPDSYDDFFGNGLHISAKNFFYEDEEHLPGPYDPREALQKKASCHKPRNQLNSSEYARGKICFGAYSRKLVNRAVGEFGELFHHSSPDYTSMILASSLAGSAYELKNSGIVHVSTNISNGAKNATHDDECLKAIKSLENGLSFFPMLPVPNLYSSQHNWVLHDYTTLKEKFSLQYEVDIVNWLIHISEDLHLDDRVWSSHEVEKKQKEILRNFISSNLNSEEKDRYERLTLKKARDRPKYRKKKHEPVHCDTIYSILNKNSFN